MKFNHDEFMKDLSEFRYATKRFESSKKVSEGDWKLLEESLRLSPSSYGLQPWKFLIVQNPEVRQKLRAASWNQSQVTDCSHYVVLTTLKKVTETYVQKFIKSTATTRGLAVENLKGYEDMMIGDLVKGPRAQVISAWSQRQAYIAMGNLMNTAAFLHIDTCPLEGLDPAQYDQILNLSATEYSTVAAVAVGYRHAEDTYATNKKVRFASSEVIQWIK